MPTVKVKQVKNDSGDADLVTMIDDSSSSRNLVPGGEVSIGELNEGDHSLHITGTASGQNVEFTIQFVHARRPNGDTDFSDTVVGGSYGPEAIDIEVF